MKSHTKVTEIVPYSELSSEEKTLWNKAKRFMTWFYDFDVDRDLLIARDFKQHQTKKQGVSTTTRDEKAYIHVDLLVIRKSCLVSLFTKLQSWLHRHRILRENLRQL